MEAERLRLPDEVLQFAEGLLGGTRRGQRRLDQAQVGHVLGGARVGQVGVPGPGGSQPLRGVQQVGPVRFRRRPGGDLGQQFRVGRRGGGQRPAQAGGGRRGLLVEGQRAADPAGRILQRPQHVVGLDGRGLPGDRRGHIRVAVPVGTHPAAEPQEGRHRGGPGLGALLGQRTVEFPVHDGYHPEQRLVERRHDRADLVDRVHRLDPQLGCPPQQVDALLQGAPRLGPVSGPGPPVVEGAEQLVDAAQHGDHGPSPRLGGMRGQYQVDAQRSEQLGQLLLPAVVADLGHRGRERLAHRIGTGVTLPHEADALMFLGQVDEVEVDGEGPGHLLGPVQVPGADQGRDRVRGAVTRLVAGIDHDVPEPLHVGQHVRAGLRVRVADDLPEDVAQQPDVAAHRLREFGSVPRSVHVHVASVIRACVGPVKLMT